MDIKEIIITLHELHGKDASLSDGIRFREIETYICQQLADHKAVVDKMQNKIEELEKEKHVFKDSLQFIAETIRDNNEDISLINEICDLYEKCFIAKGIK